VRVGEAGFTIRDAQVIFNGMKESAMKTKTDDLKQRNDYRPLAAARQAKAILWVALAFALPNAASAQAYPNGAYTTGVITQVWSINGLLRFIVQGTLDDNTTGAQAFWIDSTATGGSLRVANILSAAAQGKTVSIWNTGTTYAAGGQTGYWSNIEITNY
jgi:hypothetical protein